MTKLPKSKAIDLTRMTQSQISFVTGRPGRWLREHGELFVRDGDGFYDIRQVVAALIQQARPPVFDDSRFFLPLS